MTAQMSFASGEIAPSLYARTDQARYQIGLRTCRNHFIAKSGGAFSRPGTQFIGETKLSDRSVRLVEFVFSDDQSYILEFGHLYIRFYQNGARVRVSGVAAWSGATTYAIGDLVSDGGINYYAIDASLNKTPASFPLLWYPLTGDIYEIPSPYEESELDQISYSQSADVLALAHSNHLPKYLSRLGQTRWTLIDIDLNPAIAPPPPPLFFPTIIDTSIPQISYRITAISATGEESLPFLTRAYQTVDPSQDDTEINVTWNASPGAIGYNIYRAITQGTATSYSLNSGFIGTSTVNNFSDSGQVATSKEPPSQIVFTGTSGDNPSVVLFTQNRLAFAGRISQPETIYMSRIGSFGNFTVKTPVENDDSIVFTINGSRVDIIRHLIELDRLISMTSNNEWAIRGNQDGVITPTAINAKKQSENGVSRLTPIIASETILFVQARQNIVRDFMFNFELGPYQGNDLTVFSSHLFESKQIISWSYQKTPHSIAWLILSDGTMLSMTYNRDHQMLAWGRHDTDGVIEDIATIPEGSYDRNYLIVKRTVDGEEKRYIERMLSRDKSNPFEFQSLDSMLYYDGLNTNETHKMKLSGHGGLKPDGTYLLTLVSDNPLDQILFDNDDIGDEYKIIYADGTEVDFVVDEVPAGHQVWVLINSVVPASLLDVETANWFKKVSTVSGLAHLEDKRVSVVGDGFVLHSAANLQYPPNVVSSGSLTLSKAYSRIFVGLPYISDLETLDLDSYQGERKNATRIEIFVEASKGIFAGNKPPTDDEIDPLEDLREFKLRTTEAYNEPTRLFTERLMVDIPGEWTKGGRVFIRQIDPIPLSILSVQPMGFVPSRGGQ